MKLRAIWMAGGSLKLFQQMKRALWLRSEEMELCMKLSMEWCLEVIKEGFLLLLYQTVLVTTHARASELIQSI